MPYMYLIDKESYLKPMLDIVAIFSNSCIAISNTEPIEDDDNDYTWD